jgi:hypothetical protein
MKMKKLILFFLIASSLRAQINVSTSGTSRKNGKTFVTVPTDTFQVGNYTINPDGSVSNSSGNKIVGNFIVGTNDSIGASLSYVNLFGTGLFAPNSYTTAIGNGAGNTVPVPFGSAFVLDGYNLINWHPVGFSGLYSSFEVLDASSPHCRDTMLFSQQVEKNGSSSDASAFVQYNFGRYLNSNGSSTNLTYTNYRTYESFNNNGLDDIHFNIYAYDIATKGWGQVSIDNGQFGILHGNRFLANDSDNVFFGRNHFYGQTRIDSNLSVPTVNGFILKQGASFSDTTLILRSTVAGLTSTAVSASNKLVDSLSVVPPTAILMPSEYYSNSTGQAWIYAKNILTVQPFYNPRTTTITHLGVYVGGKGSACTHLTIGIYTTDGNLIGYAIDTVTGVGVMSGVVNGGSFVLPSGTILVGITDNGTTCNTLGLLSLNYNVVNLMNAVAVWNGYSANAANTHGNAPATLGTITLYNQSNTVYLPMYILAW